MSRDPQQLWEGFFTRQNLTAHQQELFKIYYDLLVATNKLHNITAITDLETVITHHFDDSLALRDIIDCTTLKGLGDIGTGAGFPGLPLKIIYPALPLVLIEVSAKKRAFLQDLVDEFQLTDVIISERDWRTFLRKTSYDIDLFCARASLHPEELVRMFKPVSPYKHGQLVYWASQSWEPSELVRPYITKRYSYQIGDKKRMLVLMANPVQSLVEDLL